jgi:hypothetical protein
VRDIVGEEEEGEVVPVGREVVRFVAGMDHVVSSGIGEGDDDPPSGAGGVPDVKLDRLEGPGQGGAIGG